MWEPRAHLLLISCAVLMRSNKAETAVHGCWPLSSIFILFFLVATGFCPFYHCRLSEHACGFNIPYLHLDFSTALIWQREIGAGRVKWKNVFFQLTVKPTIPCLKECGFSKVTSSFPFPVKRKGRILIRAAKYTSIETTFDFTFSITSKSPKWEECKR